MNRYLLFSIIFIYIKNIDCISIKYRRWCSPWKFCSFTSWKTWESCDKTCGGGIRTRYRQMCSLPFIDFTQHVAMCHKTLNDFIEYEYCSQTCSQYGIWSNETNQCICNDISIVDSCCMTDRGRWSEWSTWSRCIARCGTYGIRNRTRMCLWKHDLIKRDIKNINCIGDRVQYESCLKDCHEPEYDEEFFEKMPSNTTVMIGKHAQFVCKQKSGNIKWLINDQDVSILSIQNPSIKIVSNGTILFIYPITNYFSSQTRITCQINMLNGEHINRYAWMLIDTNDNDNDNDNINNSIDNQCSLIKPLESIYYVRLGSSFSIQCQAKTLNATVLWYKNDILIHNNGEDNIQILINYMLFINTIDLIHNASFSCTVQTTLKCKQTSYWKLIVFEYTQQISNNLQTNPLNFVGTYGIVLPGSTPWHVTISYRDISMNFFYDAFCSGLFIDENTILSISQCFDKSSSLQTYLKQQNLIFDLTKLIIYVSKYDRLSISLFERQSTVKQLLYSNNDFIILKVHLLFMSIESRPLPLPTMNDMAILINNVSLYATGWGPLSTNADKPMRLKYIQQRLTDCNISSSSPSPITLCTTAMAIKQPNLCPGDTGGILFAQTNQRIFAVGLISRFSKAFCDMRSTQITTILRLDTITTWLKQNSLV
ncbi:unnamed protein product [Rotaria sordida]|uniref:Uncharacterized protein n=1 Tax=Rotaria sordida TaxID=392033 RepID=A0A815MJ96_9BILA|nr:unnamed protein product [Rotaria sordida]CAF4003456.1 unnamed protein product [Rotaria sordida]